MNDCLLESENFQITKSDNNKYLLLPVKKQDVEKFVLKECGKDIDSHTKLLSLTYTTNTFHLLLLNKIRKENPKSLTQNSKVPKKSHNVPFSCSSAVLFAAVFNRSY